MSSEHLPIIDAKAERKKERKRESKKEKTERITEDIKYAIEGNFGQISEESKEAYQDFQIKQMQGRIKYKVNYEDDDSICIEGHEEDEAGFISNKTKIKICTE